MLTTSITSLSTAAKTCARNVRTETVHVRHVIALDAQTTRTAAASQVAGK